MSNVFVTSDTHFAHSLMAQLRGFRRGSGAVEEHDAFMIENWNKYISKRDIVYHLGDFFLGRTGELEGIVSQLNGTIHLITGNHDRVWPAMQRSSAYTKRWLEAGFESIQQYKVLHVRSKDVVGKVSGKESRKLFLNHFPYVTDESSEHDWQYKMFAPTVTGGLVLLHGHTHSTETYSAETDAPAVHVGFDAWKRPVALEEIVTFLDEEGPKRWENFDRYWKP